MTTASMRLRALAPRLPRADVHAASVGFAATLAGVLLVTMASVAALGAIHGSRALPGVRVGNVDIGGLDRAAAEARLRETLPSLSEGAITVRAGDAEGRIPFGSVGRDYRLDEMLNAALAMGQDGNAFERTAEALRALLVGVSVPVQAGHDEAALERELRAAAHELLRPPRDASVTLSDSGSFEVVRGVAGRRVDFGRAREAVSHALASTSPGDVTVSLAVSDVAPAVSTEHAARAAARANAMTASDVTLTTGEESFVITSEELRAWIEFGRNGSGTFGASIAETRAEAAVRALAAEVDRPARDATYVIEGGTISVAPSVTGRATDVSATTERVVAALERRTATSEPPSVELVVTTTAPALTTEAAQAALPQMEVISSWTTYFTPNPGDFWGENIAVPTRILDGRVVAPGEWFEFWSAIGPVTEERGYGPGGAIINGRSVATGALAGGICSTSTTLFNAALRAGLEIGDRTNHYYFIPRYPTGLDATVYQDGSSVLTMSFRNDTPYPIIIRGYNGYGTVRFDLVSVPTGRSVHLSEPVIWNERKATDEVEYTTDLAPGVEERLEYPHDGFETSVTRTVTDANGAVIHQETYYSNYKPVNGILRVGKAEEE